MHKRTFCFFVLAGGFFYLYFKVLGLTWNALSIRVSGINNLIGFAIIVLVIVPMALISAKKLTNFFVPKSDNV
ncbi:hypothetical protein IM538_13780 [Cytobacillus suaedae]|nr:hypothetical protein IM538_13780 [Cytobacillus suaedae]